MACNGNQDCGPNQICIDGQCADAPEAPEELPLRRKTFTTAWSEYAGEFKQEQQKVKEYGDQLSDVLDEAARKRREEAEAQQDAGLFGSIVGALLTIPLGPVGIAVGAGLGYGTGSGLADWAGDAEKYGISEDDYGHSALAYEGQLKYLSETKQDIKEDALDLQYDLDQYDKNEWKQHVIGGIQAGWNAYQLAGLGKSLWEGGKNLFQNIGKDASDEVTEVILEDNLDLDRFAYDIDTSLDTYKG